MNLRTKPVIGRAYDRSLDIPAQQKESDLHSIEVNRMQDQLTAAGNKILSAKTALMQCPFNDRVFWATHIVYDDSGQNL